MLKQEYINIIYNLAKEFKPQEQWDIELKNFYTSGIDTDVYFIIKIICKSLLPNGNFNSIHLMTNDS